MSALLEITRLRRLFELRGAKKGKQPRLLHAVDNVSFNIAEGESIGMVGESGCGKSTLARLIVRLLEPSDGDLVFKGHNLLSAPLRLFARSPERAKLQMVFQDPTDSLNPRYTTFDTIAEPLRLLANMRERQAIQARVEELAGLVGLPRELLPRFPHQLSGGQKARVGIARAIALNPKLLVLDEPTSALDVSVQAVILHLLADLREKLGMSYLFVSHDLNVVRLLCSKVIVMYLGKIVEAGPVEEIFERPRHPYTKALISAIPGLHATTERIRLTGEPQSPIDPDPKVCRFVSRCSKAQPRCSEQMPELVEVGGQHQAACHFPL